MSQNEMHFDVAIIGAGFSGMMVAVHLGVGRTSYEAGRILCRRKYRKSGRGETGGGESSPVISIE